MKINPLDCGMVLVPLLLSGCETVPPPSGVPLITVVPVQESAAPATQQVAQVIVSSPVRFAPTHISKQTDAYADAGKIYDSSPSADQGVYQHGDLVFVIVVIDTQREKIKHLEGTAMLRTVALLRQKFPKLPAEFNVRNRLLEKDLDDDTGIYRYATVQRLADIERLAGQTE